MKATERDHDSEIVDQFSKQAEAFARKLRSEHESAEAITGICGITTADRVLDVACGPGLLSCSVAPHCEFVVGIDITPRMIEQAAMHREELGLSNIAWAIGDAGRLPFADFSFAVVITRFSFHHLERPEVVLAEMVRVCAPGGRVAVADMAPPPVRAEAFNRMERLRDPSHVRALAPGELDDIVQKSGLSISGNGSLKLEMELEKQLASSFPRRGDADKIRQMFRDDLRTNSMGVDSCLVNGEIMFSYPVYIVAGRKDKRLPIQEG